MLSPVANIYGIHAFYSDIQRLIGNAMEHMGESSDLSYQSSLPFRIESRGDLVGRYLVASRDIKAGEIVFREKKPLAVGPNPLSQPQCIKCHVKVTIDKFQ